MIFSKICSRVWWSNSLKTDASHSNQKHSESTHSGDSKTVPTASLAPFAAELRIFEVWPFSAKIRVATTENHRKSQFSDFGAAFGRKNHVFDQKSHKIALLRFFKWFGEAFSGVEILRILPTWAAHFFAFVVKTVIFHLLKVRCTFLVQSENSENFRFFDV